MRRTSFAGPCWEIALGALLLARARDTNSTRTARWLASPGHDTTALEARLRTISMRGASWLLFGRPAGSPSHGKMEATLKYVEAAEEGNEEHS